MFKILGIYTFNIPGCSFHIWLLPVNLKRWAGSIWTVPGYTVILPLLGVYGCGSSEPTDTNY